MALHDADAAARFPGPDSYQVLGWIHEALKPETYLEVGVLGGCSLRLAQPPTVALGIDPAPLDDGPWCTDTQLFRLTSTEFFTQHDPRRLLGGKPVAFAFIDGRHLFDQVIEDLFHLERHMAPHGIVALHDTIPLDRETSARRRTTEFYTGDVWKTLPFLRQERPDLEFVTVETAPTGLTLIRGWDPNRSVAPPSDRVAEFAALDFDYFERHSPEFLEPVPNDRAAVEAFCQNTPVQSIRSSGSVIFSRSR